MCRRLGSWQLGRREADGRTSSVNAGFSQSDFRMLTFRGASGICNTSSGSDGAREPQHLFRRRWLSSSRRGRDEVQSTHAASIPHDTSPTWKAGHVCNSGLSLCLWRGCFAPNPARKSSPEDAFACTSTVFSGFPSPASPDVTYTLPPEQLACSQINPRYTLLATPNSRGCSRRCSRRPESHIL